MNDMTPTREQREAKLEGMGCKRKRVEDIRFTQGKGNYVDDLKLPGMLHGDFVRSPHAHARVKSIDDKEALKVPGVLAVITGADVRRWTRPFVVGVKQPMEHWCLAMERVRFVGEPVAVVLAADRYRAEDVPELRTRMNLIGSVPALAASAAQHYDAWERAVGEFAASRLGQPAESLYPLAIGRATLAVCRSAYERWAERADADLTVYLDQALRALAAGFEPTVLADGG